jgi:hypothetical protein
MLKIQKFLSNSSNSSCPSDLVLIARLVDEKKAQFVIRETQIGVINFTTIDCKLPIHKEDKLYEDPYIHTLIPRGCCFIFANNTFVHSIYGHSKFGNDGQYLFNENINGKNFYENGFTKVFRRKENGECCRMSFFKYNEIIYFVSGSKNVHIITRLDNFESDITLYTEQRYSFATKIAKELHNKFNKIDFPKLLSYALETGYAFCGEICSTDSQHLVQYDTNDVYFFAITYSRIDCSDSIVKVCPTMVDDLFKSFGLSHVKETIIVKTFEQQVEAEIYFETQVNSEGAVVSVVDTTGNTVYVYKHKNYDYIFLRCVREQMRKKATPSRILARIHNLHITHPNLEKITKWSLMFNAYFRLLTETEQLTFFENWVTHKNNFDKISESNKQKLFNLFEEHNKSKETLVVKMLVAIPGSGKSFIGRSIKEIITEIGQIDGKKVKVVHLEQDMFYKEAKAKKPKDKSYAGKLYDAAIKAAIEDDELNYLILSKSNHNEEVRNKTYKILDTCKKNVELSFITISCDDDLHKTAELCIERIMNRGHAHESLYGMDKEQIRGIIYNTFVAQFKPVSEKEHNGQIVHLNMEDTKEDMVISCIEQLKDLGVFKLDYDLDLIKKIFNKISKEDEQLANKNIINIELDKNSSKNNTLSPNVSYDAIIFNKESLEDIIKMIYNPKSNLILKNEFHITLEYYGSIKQSKAPFFQENVEHAVIVKGYAMDNKALALLVEIVNYDGINETVKQYHITMALAPTIKAVYSGELIKTALHNNTFVQLTNHVLKGTSKRIFHAK